MSRFENLTINQLKDEYITLAFGTMIFDADTKIKRDEISAEIERRELAGF